MSTATKIATLEGGDRANALAAMTPKQRVVALLNERRADIAKMLPSHLSADRLLKVAAIAATTTPALLECETPSLITAVGQCAMFGLEPNTVLGHAYMIPFNKNEKDRDGNFKRRKLVQVIIGYKGLIDLARRSGQIVSISAHEVREHDDFDYAYGLDEKLHHRPADGPRGEITHFYAYAKLKDGGTAFEVMSVAQVNEIRDAAALKNGAKRQPDGSVPITGPWKDHYVEMGRKTVIRRLAKYLPLSVEFQQAAALDEAAERGAAVGAIDGEFTIDKDDDGQGCDEPPETGLPEYSADLFAKNLPAWAGLIQSGKKTADQIIAMVSTKHQLSQEQQAQIRAVAQSGAPDEATLDQQIESKLRRADSLDVLDVAADLINEVPDQARRAELTALYKQRQLELSE